ncbi:MAG: hypothetical protein AAGA30_04930 [Planctomycetota bacterium]
MVSESSTILFLTQDLMMQSQAAAATNGTDFKIVTAGNLSSFKEKLGERSPVVIFVDLQTLRLDVANLAEILNQQAGSILTIAFAQHVEVELLKSAKLDSIDRVMTRGQFSQQLPELISELSSG